MFKTLKFTNNDSMPIIGLGTWKLKPQEVDEVITTAIELGYRHFDCASVYRNEKAIGASLKKNISTGKVKREELWITSKLWNNAHLPKDVQSALKKTLSDLQLDYLDLYLIHWPIAHKPNIFFPKKDGDFLSYQDAPLENTWEEMIQIRETGSIRHIGVSNFNSQKMELLLNSKQPPEINQVELHPYLPQEQLVSWCGQKKIHLTAYSPLGSFDPNQQDQKNKLSLFQNDEIQAIAKELSVSQAQVLIAWSIHRGIAVIPKSSNKARLKENIDANLIHFSEDQFQRLNYISKETKHRFVKGDAWTTEISPYSLEDIWEDDNKRN